MHSSGERGLRATSRRRVVACFALLLLVAWPRAVRSADEGRIPVALDTDIGDDIDDAFALALLLRSRSVELKAVTTVNSDTTARARIAAKMLAVAGWPTVPVAAGTAKPGKPFAQAQWAEGFQSPALVAETAVALLHRTIAQEHGRLVLIAIGPLSNVAALLRQYPGDSAGIKEIVLMGGSVHRGYYPGSGPTAESNIATDPQAAQAVFTSGVPLLVAPLDVTAALQLDEAERAEIFDRQTPLTRALHELYGLWDQPTPTLHDPMAVALLLHPAVSQTRPLSLSITNDGMMHVEPGKKPNAMVALVADPAKFVRYYESMFQGQ